MKGKGKKTRLSYITVLLISLCLLVVISNPNTNITGHPEDVWFHVDNLSSAHVYLRMKSNNNTDNDSNSNNMTIDDLHEELIIDCATLVKANSIAGCKVRTVYENIYI